ncbi:MAG: segregation and condensation protein A [Gemmatimonadota bacterium]
MSVAAGPSVADLLQLEPFVVELERFQGPLDLLLHLIRSQDIDIFDIPIARITEQFQAAIERGLEDMPLERAGEFIEMAATLVRVKAQMLLPRSRMPEWEEDPRAELVRRLLEYEHFRDVVHVLEAAEAQRARHFPKGYIEPRRPPPDLLPELQLRLDEFLAAAARIPEPLPPPVVAPPTRAVTVGQKVSLVRRLLREAKRIAFDRLVEPWGTRPHAVAALLACLELARQHVVRLEQTGPFGSIWLLRGRGPRRSRGKKAR